jgi:hypothetical protein
MSGARRFDAGGSMSFRKPAAILAVLALGAAVAVLTGGSLELKAAKGTVVEALPAQSACPQEPWPFGCQWREPTRRVTRNPRPS